MSENDAFDHILGVGQSAGQANAPLLLDLGCCSKSSPHPVRPTDVIRSRIVGTDLRHIVQSGYPSTSVIGCDIRRDFIDLGHALYADSDTCAIPFFVGDVFDIVRRPFPQAADDACPSLKDVRSLNELCGRVKYLYAGAIFHLFDEGTQEAIARRLVTLLDVTEGNGPAVLFGRHPAKEAEGVIDDALGRYVKQRACWCWTVHVLKGMVNARPRYAHSPASWGKLWQRALGGKIRVRVEAEFRLEESTERVNPGRGTEMMRWSVWVG